MSLKRKFAEKTEELLASTPPVDPGQRSSRTAATAPGQMLAFRDQMESASAQIEALGQALDQYRLDTGRYPTSEQNLAALRSAPSGETRWSGPYLKRDVPQDPWGHAYQYRSPGQHGDYDLLSLGSDGQPGGDGESADIVSW